MSDDAIRTPPSALLTRRVFLDYFNTPSRRVRLKKGDILFDQDQFNDRLYLIISGDFSGTVRMEDELGKERQAALFRNGPNTFVGVLSFFSHHKLTATRVTCVSDGEVAWISRNTPPVNPEQHGSLLTQFVPLIIEELQHRQSRLAQTTQEREAALHRLHLAEKLSTLGQLSAGLAHELNNAIGVILRTSDQLSTALGEHLRRTMPEEAGWFDRGLRQGQIHSSAVVRERARQLEKDGGLDYATAKRLARVLGPDDPGRLPDDLDTCLSLWETGQACHDMLFAAQHAASIVRSIKQLGGASDALPRQEIDLGSSLHEALALVQSDRRQINIEMDLEPGLPLISGNVSELTQIWVNIIKNACEALKEARTSTPRITICARANRQRSIEVAICNNGPQIPDHLLDKLFLPNITTKRTGSAVGQGLGLGLCIVKRLVDSYYGELRVETSPSQTCFRVILPLNHTSDVQP
ncbi:MAG TPA: cyclic nucleotide-binding domain-containing protein [Candidatus Avidesulfovibrio excrementigallinarum]|nr:cyclic nucleotide-binding domain-containing protein [Candidatus Avidesulfovibrio excrementigallinarum]